MLCICWFCELFKFNTFYWLILNWYSCFSLPLPFSSLIALKRFVNFSWILSAFVIKVKFSLNRFFLIPNAKMRFSFFTRPLLCICIHLMIAFALTQIQTNKRTHFYLFPLMWAELCISLLLLFFQVQIDAECKHRIRSIHIKMAYSIYVPAVLCFFFLLGTHDYCDFNKNFAQSHTNFFSFKRW